MELSYEDVFKPGTFPQYTYITRYSEGTNFTYEQRLKQCIGIDGFLTTIVGPSKSGKTVLCDKVIGTDNEVPLSGNDFKLENDFWGVIAKKVGISMSGQYSQTAHQKNSAEDTKTTTIECYMGCKDRVVEYFIKEKKVLILDDFHQAPENVQYDIACQLKDVIRRGFKVVVISLPHRADDTIRFNPDLNGRINLIDVEPWKDDELEKIALTGFGKLNVGIGSEMAHRIAMESLHSPLLMQSICLNIKYVQRSGNEKIVPKLIEESCRFTCINYPYATLVRILRQGPPTRGQRRKKYEIRDGCKLDIYAAILKVIAENPPKTVFDFDEIKKRIDELLTEERDKITGKKVKDTMINIQNIINEREGMFQVFEWKDNSLYVLDPLFLFFLRWKGIDG